MLSRANNDLVTWRYGSISAINRGLGKDFTLSLSILSSKESK